MKITQGDRIASRLMAVPHTYLEMNQLCMSVSPQKRVLEWLDLPANRGWRLEKGRRWLGGKRYAVTWQIVPNV